MKKKTVFLIVTLALVVGAYAMYKYLYKDHRNIAAEAVAVTVNSEELESFFLNNNGPDVLNKTVAVTGIVTSIEPNALTLDHKVQCAFDHLDIAISMGQQLTIKGRCIGYDDLFEIVKLDQSNLTQ